MDSLNIDEDLLREVNEQLDMPCQFVNTSSAVLDEAALRELISTHGDNADICILPPEYIVQSCGDIMSSRRARRVVDPSSLFSSYCSTSTGLEADADDPTREHAVDAAADRDKDDGVLGVVEENSVVCDYYEADDSALAAVTSTHNIVELNADTEVLSSVDAADVAASYVEAAMATCLVELNHVTPGGRDGRSQIVRLNDDEIVIEEYDESNAMHRLQDFQSNNIEIIETQQITFNDGSTAYINANDCGEYIKMEIDDMDYNEHVRPNTNSRPQLERPDRVHRCDEPDCNRAYTTRHHLRMHKRGHTTSARPFVCLHADCGKKFTTAYALKAHDRVHTNIRPYPCVYRDCKKAFKTCGDLQKHTRTHTGERPFVCTFKNCNRTFTTSNIRKVHIRTHTGERPFKCEFEDCNKTFSSVTNYTNHKRIHTGEKPYQCQEENCWKRFTEYSSLHKHLVLHTGEKPFICHSCNRTFRQMKALLNHKKNQHADDSPVLETDRISDAEYERRNLLRKSRMKVASANSRQNIKDNQLISNSANQSPVLQDTVHTITQTTDEAGTPVMLLMYDNRHDSNIDVCH